MPTHIQWTQETWNPTVGCSKVSPGCENCYAIRMAYRLAHIPATKELYQDVVKKTDGGKTNWTGEIKINQRALKKPFEFKKPTLFFVDSMSDLFHENLDFNEIEKIFSVIEDTPWHTFQILTKRPERVLAFFEWRKKSHRWYSMEHYKDIYPGYSHFPHPLPHVWIGVSVENQKYADERIPLLLQTPATIRFLSCEPLLEDIDIDKYLPHLDWIIVGGESGPGARPLHPDIVRHICVDCKEAKVPFFFKQWGDWIPLQMSAQHPFWYYPNGEMIDAHALPEVDTMEESKGWDNGMWCIEEDLEQAIFHKVGKEKAGNHLDGMIYEEFPVAREKQPLSHGFAHPENSNIIIDDSSEN